jgi:hypothetical protein
MLLLALRNARDYAASGRRGITMAVVLTSPVVIGQPAITARVPTFAVAWSGAPVLAWAVSGGRRRAPPQPCSSARPTWRCASR